MSTCDTNLPAHVLFVSVSPSTFKKMAHAALVDAGDAATSASINFFGSEDDFLSEDLFDDMSADADAKKQRKDRVDWIRYDGMFTKSSSKAKLLVHAAINKVFSKSF